MQILGVDTGGTFTDLVYFDGQNLHVHKELSTPSAPERAILNGITALGIEIGDLHIVHGTTVATNALLEGKGARTVFITNHGFKDLLLIGRQTRKELYNLTPKKVRTIFDPQLCLEVGGRINAQGQTLQPLSTDELDELTSKINQLNAEAVAICLLFSFVDDSYEREVRKRLDDQLFVSISSEVLAEYREYERGLATWINSYLGPVMHGYLSRLRKQLQSEKISVMQSHGLTLNAGTAQNNAVRLLLSGPAGGLWGSLHAGKNIGHTQLLTFDMGGTSTDVSIINKDFKLTNHAEISEFPIAVPMLDIHTIGAGGGSIAWIDEGGLLQVGPESAGAIPGPACYAQGGTLATVTDAHVVLGRLPLSCKLAGNLSLDYKAAERAVENIAQKLNLDIQACAKGIVQIANEQMVQALRVISVHRGHDPNNFTLVSFGGAGGLHVCDLANALNIKYALVPENAGVLSAFGLLIAPPGKEDSLTHIKLLEDCKDSEIEKLFSQLEKKIRKDLEAELSKTYNFKREIDVRYHGQSAALKLAWINTKQSANDFHKQHKNRYGYALNMAVELVNLRLTISGDSTVITTMQSRSKQHGSPLEYVILHELDQQVPVYKRTEIAINQELIGPAIITEKEATLYLAPHWCVSVQGSGGLLLKQVDKK